MEKINLPEDLKELMNHHGHLCFGVLLGYKAVLYAVDIIGKSDNMMVLTESNGCGNDAVRFILNCTEENGKLRIKEGKRQVWSVYNFEEEEGVRLTVNPNLQTQLPKDKDQALSHIIEMPGSLLFFAEPFNCECHGN